MEVLLNRIVKLCETIVQLLKNKPTNFLVQYQGIIGVIIGFFANFFLTYLNNNIGKVSFFFNNYSFTFKKFNQGDVEVSGCLEESQWLEYELDIDIFNNATVFKGLRDFQIVFETKYTLVKDKPYDPSLTIYTEYARINKPISVLNIPPRTLINQKLKGSINKDEDKNYNFIKDSTIYLTALNTKGKLYKIKISKIDNKTVQSIKE